jgi:hypothetical protein
MPFEKNLHIVLRTAGNDFANSMLEEEEYENPMADMLWYLSAEYVLVAGSMKQWYYHYRLDYRKQLETTTPTSWQDFQEAFAKGYITVEPWPPTQ